MPPREVEKLFRAFVEKRKAELPRFTPDGIPITPENRFDDGIYAFLYNYWKEHSGEYDPKGNVVASNTANHLSLEYKTENELKFAQWAMREYGMTNKERTTHTFKGQMSVLLEVWNVVDMITLPVSLVSAGGKFIGKEVAKEVAEELGEKAVKEVAKEAVEKTVKREVAEEAIKNPVKREVAEEAIEKTVKTEVSEEIAESAARKEMVDTAEGLSQKPINKNDALENSSSAEAKIPRTGDEWYEYFNEKYGKGNVTWKPTPFDDILQNPERLYGSTQEEIANILGDGWTAGNYGITGEGWKFTSGDRMVFYHSGGRHGGVYYGFSTSLTGKVKIVGENYIPLPGDKATVIYFKGSE